MHVPFIEERPSLFSLEKSPFPIGHKRSNCCGKDDPWWRQMKDWEEVEKGYYPKMFTVNLLGFFFFLQKANETFLDIHDFYH